ncbi:DUF1579 family protein [Nonomuraea rhodomycinica]|uniref:DUF1579 family protein n=1 Tax=Nonomuraea rhodomycinica TaxID=1712872 RepID=A0A7Y6IN66_9ACTN|nr:DUF1579 family protein [Nonomuraea rhodomycinica]NUW41031.1 DUF1579 family protein [Nonomuraea rhodomycinica]
MLNRLSLSVISAVAVLALTGTPAAATAPVTGTAQITATAPVTAAAVRTQGAPSDPLAPGPYHRRLDPLAGTWKATKYNYILGRDGRPVVSRDITVRTRWIAKTGGRFLEEQTEGVLGGHPYYRLGILGFSTIDRRYEWTTFDSVTPTAMTYRGPALSKGSNRLSLPGEFTDPGVLGPEYAGKTIPMRTVITIRSDDRHTFELYFTPPGQSERLVDRVVYTRRAR